MTAPVRRARISPGGYTYLGLLFAIAIMGVALAAAGELSLTLRQRERERELLFIGNQFRQAIDEYNRINRARGEGLPRTLEELIEDRGHLPHKRYLRKLFADPFTGSTEWGLIRTPQGGILGVHTLHEGRPFKIANFRQRDAAFAGRTRYSEWRFVIDLPAPPVQTLQRSPAREDQPQAVAPPADARRAR